MFYMADNSFPNSNHMTSSKQVDTLICHTTMHRNYINFLYNPGQVALCFEVVLMVYARVKGLHNICIMLSGLLMSSNRMVRPLNLLSYYYYNTID